MDLKNAPKQFCDNIQIGYSDDFFIMATLSGNTATVFALTPQHAKKLAQYLEHNIADYEKKFGKIDAEWVNGVRSPLQISEPKKPNTE